MTMTDCMNRMSHREYQTRLAWMQKELNTPDRTDFYLMQIAQEVRRVLHKKPAEVNLDQFKLKFSLQSAQSTETQKQQAIAWSKHRWLSAVGDKIKKVVRNERS